jgi:hypothetical protein
MLHKFIDNKTDSYKFRELNRAGGEGDVNGGDDVGVTGWCSNQK